MSEEPTQQLPDDTLRQLLTRLDSIDARLGDMNGRLEKLEVRAYDTKPMWENALKEIADTRVEMREGFESVRGEMGEGFASVRAEMREGFERVDKEFEKVRIEIDDAFRDMERKQDVLNKYFLETRAEFRYINRRIDKLDPEMAK